MYHVAINCTVNERCCWQECLEGAIGANLFVPDAAIPFKLSPLKPNELQELAKSYNLG